MGGQAIDPIAHGIDRLFRPMPLDRQGDRGLGAVEQNDPAELLVRRDVIVLAHRAGGQNPSRRACGRRPEWPYRAAPERARRRGGGKTG